MYSNLLDIFVIISVVVSINLVGGHLLIKFIMDRLREEGRVKPRTDYEKKMALRVGILERIIYIISLLFYYPEFIGFWLIVKVVGGWSRRESGRVDRFLIGTGLSILVSVFTWMIIKLYLNSF